MRNSKALVTVLAVTAALGGGVAYAAQGGTPTPAMSRQEATLHKDASRLSADGAQAFLDVSAARLAIFDGRTDSAKKLVHEADADFGKAKNDRTAFVKAEADLKSPAKSAGTGQTATADTKKPTMWLPVNGEILVKEDYTTNKTKSAAVSQANKSLAKGDRNGAMQTLKLADVNVDFIVAVVPLDQTVADIHKAADMIDGGKYYEANQMLRQVQLSIRLEAVDFAGVPAPVHSAEKGANADSTH